MRDHWKLPPGVTELPAQDRAIGALLADPKLKHAIFADIEDEQHYSIGIAVRDPATGEMASALLKGVAILPSALLSMVDALSLKGNTKWPWA
jgi:hypothetical protein